MSAPRQSYSEYERKWLRINFKRDQPQHILQESFAKKFKGKRISQATVSQSLGDDWEYLDRFALEELSKNKFRRSKEPRKKVKQRLKSVDLRDLNRKSGGQFQASAYSPLSPRRPSINTSPWATPYSPSGCPSHPIEYLSPAWTYATPLSTEIDRPCAASFNSQSTYNFQSLTLTSPITPTDSQPSFPAPWSNDYGTSLDATLTGYFVEDTQPSIYFLSNPSHHDRDPLRILTNVTFNPTTL